MASYLVTFERIGRNHPEPMQFEDVSDADEFAARIHERARKFLLSSGVDVTVDLEKMTGRVYTGARPAGSFTIKELADA